MRPGQPLSSRIASQPAIKSDTRCLTLPLFLPPQNENDPAFALISDYVSNPDPSIRVGAVLGLGLAYAGTNREEVEEILMPLVTDADVSMEVSGFAALALGLVFTSTAKEVSRERCSERCVIYYIISA